jgi:flagellar motor switch protein FliG
MSASESSGNGNGSGSEGSRLTKVQKLAALLVVLGTDSAVQIFKHMEQQEVEQISAEMAKMPMISQELQQELLQEFSGVAVAAGASVAGGLPFARTALEQAVGLFKASEIIGRVAPTRAPVVAMQGVVDMDARQLFNLIRHEQAQTVALVLSYVGPEKAAEALAYFHAELRDRIVERIATLAPIPIEVVEKVVELLVAKRGVSQTRALNQTGGVKTAADVLNSMDKNAGKSLLTAIEERNAELGLAIRQKMFTFEDLVALESSILQRILREVDMRDLALALKAASEKLKAALLSCISKRAAETVNEEIAFMGPVKLRDIESAQMRIIDSARKLEAEGEIDLGEGRRTPVA